MTRDHRYDVAVVTGAGGAIGSAIAARLGRDGYSVACVDSEVERARATAAGLERAQAFRCDVRKPAQVDRLREQVERRLGVPDVLVNVAGVFFTHRIPELEEADWDLLIDVNLKGTFLTCKSFLPAMIAGGRGSIVNIASTAGIEGGRDRAAYCASKGGVVLFTKSLSLDHGPDGVRINCVCPGLIDTPMADWLKQDAKALRAWAVPYVVPVAAAARVFEPSGRVRDEVVETQLRTLGGEVVRVAERFAADSSLHRANECEQAAERVAAAA
jgi:NAD(P)-dependent dehydrogenase (short-subunit alcohol dehydrogenase family)